MVGQEHVVQALTNALTQQRLHHAYLFTGTRGIGKTTVSRILAKSLNCIGPDGQGGITAEPCGVCSTCTEIDADRYIDYIEMDAASHGGKDEIRELIERAAYKPGVGRFKVFMIDEAHQLSKDAFNALLKTLEEPPEYLKFVLATTDPDKVLPTVLSRCLQFNLRPMAPATVREHLAHVLQAENVPFDDGALRLLARAARGSMRDGLSLTDQAIAYGSGSLLEDGVRTMLGAVDRSHARHLIEALARGDGAVVLQIVDGLRGLALSATGTLEEMAGVLQQMAVEQAVPGALDAQDPDTEDGRALSPLLAADETQLLYSIVLHGRSELNLMSDEYGALTMVLLRFLAFPSAQRAASAAPAAGPAVVSTPAPLPTPRAAPLRAMAPPALKLPVKGPSAEAAEAAGAADAAQAAPAAPAAPAFQTWAAKPPAAQPPQAEEFIPQAAIPAPSLPEVPRADPALGDRWAALVGQLDQQGDLQALVRELAVQSGLLAIVEASNPPLWRLAVEREPLRNPALQDKLCDALAALLGHAVALDVQAGSPTDTPAKRDAAERQRQQAAAEVVIHADPVVQQLLAQYKTARIVPGSIKPILPIKLPTEKGPTP